MISRPRETPLGGKGIRRALGIITFPSTAVPKVRVGQLVGNYILDERGGAVAKRALQYHRPTRPSMPGRANRNQRHHIGPRLVIRELKSRIADQIVLYFGGQCSNHLRHVLSQRCGESKGKQPIINRLIHSCSTIGEWFAARQTIAVFIHP
jgi:hypothetical protein